MFNHFIRITYRNFLRNKSTFLINLIGLSTGLACVLLIFLWVSDELSVDNFFEHNDRLYMAMLNTETPNGIRTGSGTPPLLGPAMLDELPELEAVAFTQNTFFDTEGLLTSDNTELLIDGLFASPNVFEVLSYRLIEGDAASVLARKNNMVISEALASKLFTSTAEALGQTVTWNSPTWGLEGVFQVSGVFQSPPASATKQFDAVIDFQWMVDSDHNAGLWPSGYAETFLLLKPGTDVNTFNTKIADFLKSKHPTREQSSLFLQRYGANYLYGKFENGVLAGGRIAYIRLFSAIAIFILIIACVNFMNLSTSHASLKRKEIGVKKTIGASQKSLLLQFLGESTLLALISLAIALMLVALLLPEFNILTGKELALSLNAHSMVSFIGIAIITGLMAGSYPAFYLSRFSPKSILEKSLPHSAGEQFIRKGLVVFQFTMAVIFIVGVQVINKQLRYTQEKNLGYDRENVVSFQRGPLGEGIDNEAFLSEIRALPGVVETAAMAGTIQWGQDSQAGYSWRGNEQDRGVIFKAPRIGYNAIETLNMEVLAGRTFSDEFNDDPTKIMINESAQQLMGLEDPVGQIIAYGDAQNQIIGVVRDFNYGSLYQKVEPLIFRFRDDGENIMVRIQAGAEQKTLEQLSETYKTFFPAYDFEFTFMDDAYQALYESEYRVATLSQYFSLLAILISCLGLLGLAMFVVERRTREIGIRKALGASALGITFLLSRNFLEMVGTAILIALPLSYLIAQRWLNEFAYSINLSLKFFVAAALITILIAWFTVSIHTIRAARINPATCLQQE